MWAQQQSGSSTSSAGRQGQGSPSAAGSGSASAQQAAPSEPQIVLPPVLLKVQDVAKAKIDTPLPAGHGPALPQINMALPKAQNIQVGAPAYETGTPPQGPGGQASAAPAKTGQTFFSDGVIGAGSMNHIIGDITLYKLGSEPRFTLEFSHQRLDGYLDPSQPGYFWPAGAGFFNQEDALKGSLTYSSKSHFHFDTQDSYRQTANGLQGLGNYSSVNHRFIAGKASAEYKGLAPFTFGANVEARSGDMTLASPSPQNAAKTDTNELSVTPGLSFGLDLKKVTLTASGFYGLIQNSGSTTFQYQKAGGMLSMNAQLPLALTLNGKAGAQWDTSIGWAIPFSLELDGVYQDVLSYRLYGGHRLVHRDYYSLWSSHPFLDYGYVPRTSREWYGGVSSDWRFGRTFALRGGVELSDATAALLPSALATDGTGLFSFSQGAATVLSPSLDLSWSPPGPFSVKMGWKGHFFDPNRFEPVSTVSLNADLSSGNGRYGGALAGTMDIVRYPQLGPQMPNVSLSGYYRVSQGVTFNLSMHDLLSPLLPSGRKTWDVYTDPGFRVTVSTQISL